MGALKIIRFSLIGCLLLATAYYFSRQSLILKLPGLRHVGDGPEVNPVPRPDPWWMPCHETLAHEVEAADGGEVSDCGFVERLMRSNVVTHMTSFMATGPLFVPS